MAEDRDTQRVAIAGKIAAHRQWLAAQTQASGSLSTVQYAQWRAQLTALQAEQKRLASPC